MKRNCIFPMIAVVASVVLFQDTDSTNLLTKFGESAFGQALKNIAVNTASNAASSLQMQMGTAMTGVGSNMQYSATQTENTAVNYNTGQPIYTTTAVNSAIASGNTAINNAVNNTATGVKSYVTDASGNIIGYVNNADVYVNTVVPQPVVYNNTTVPTTTAYTTTATTAVQQPVVYNTVTPTYTTTPVYQVATTSTTPVAAVATTATTATPVAAVTTSARTRR
jgi:hypothetical protein